MSAKLPEETTNYRL